MSCHTDGVGTISTEYLARVEVYADGHFVGKANRVHSQFVSWDPKECCL